MENNEVKNLRVRNPKKFWVIGSSIVLVLILLGFLVVFFNNNKSEDIKIKDSSLQNKIEEADDEIIPEEIKEYKVTFNSTGGSTIQSQIILENELAIEPSNPTRNGYNFVEWQHNGNVFDFNTRITQDIELIAIWEKISIINNDSNNKIEEETSPNINENESANDIPDTNENNITNSEIGYHDLGVWYKDKNGLSVKLNSYTKEETEGYISYKISYTLKNEVLDSKIMEGSFKLFFTDNTGEPQYGGFDYMFYGDEVNRSYEWKVLKDRQVYVLEYNADELDAGLDGAFFRDTPISTSLHWKTP